MLPVLVGDVGGTNTRMALWSGRLEGFASWSTADVPSLAAALAHYRDTVGLPQIAAAAVAVAGPVRGEQAALTNTRKNTGNLLLSWSRSFLSETLTPEYALAWEPQDGDSLHQFQLRYDWSDALTFELGGFTVLAEKQTTTFGRFKPLRQVQSQVRWVF